jgi:hypothetical protein
MPAMKREHNKENLVLIFLIATHEGILSAVYCGLPLSSRVPGTRQTSWHLY